MCCNGGEASQLKSQNSIPSTPKPLDQNFPELTWVIKSHFVVLPSGISVSICVILRHICMGWLVFNAFFNSLCTAYTLKRNFTKYAKRRHSSHGCAFLGSRWRQYYTLRFQNNHYFGTDLDWTVFVAIENHFSMACWNIDYIKSHRSPIKVVDRQFWVKNCKVWFRGTLYAQITRMRSTVHIYRTNQNAICRL